MDREGKRPARSVPVMWKATWEVYRGIWVICEVF
jgi:hypothetical protein